MRIGDEWVRHGVTFKVLHVYRAGGRAVRARVRKAGEPGTYVVDVDERDRPTGAPRANPARRKGARR